MQKAILCEHSKYFRAALEGTFSEAESNTLCFPEDSQEAWKYFLYFLYKKTLPRLVKDDTDTTRAEEYNCTLAKSYLLGHKYGLGAFQNEIVRAFVESVDIMEWFDCSDVEMMLALMPNNNPLRSLVLQELVMICEGTGTSYREVDGLETSDGALFEVLNYVRGYHVAHKGGESSKRHEYGRGSMDAYLVEEE